MYAHDHRVRADGAQTEKDNDSGKGQAKPGADPQGSSAGVEAFFSSLDAAHVTDDNDWRAVLAELKLLDQSCAEFRKAALLKYLAYIGSGQELIRTIRANRGGPANLSGTAPAISIDGGESFDAGPRQSLIFDFDRLLVADPSADAGPEEFNRMAKGDKLDVEIAMHQSLNLMLGRYRFTLVAGTPFLLIDDNGNDYRLRFGRNIVGRSAQSDVPVDPYYRAVSRKHLIVECDGSGLMKLTDISTLGTFVPRAYLDNKLH